MSGPDDDDYTRSDESEAERLDRNYAELLQELRVAQTGVQILFAFLLSIAFQQRFSSISTGERALYVITLLLAAVAAVLLIAPAAIPFVLTVAVDVPFGVAAAAAVLVLVLLTWLILPMRGRQR